jgi:hypothetical protein
VETFEGNHLSFCRSAKDSLFADAGGRSLVGIAGSNVTVVMDIHLF